MTIPEVRGYEELIRIDEPDAGLRGTIAIHNTRRGPAFGGTRMMPYASDDEARTDALALARAMAYKTAAARLPCGGGKAVLFTPPAELRSSALDRYGRIVASLGGRFFTAGDIGITSADLQLVARRAPCADESDPGLGDLGRLTAVGVWHALRACLETTGLKRPRVAIQGVGKVGRHLARLVHREGFDLVIADADPARAEAAARELGATVAPPDEILTVPCDVLAPCALGGILNARTIPALAARIVCGCANNQLAEAADAQRLRDRGILYAPDYVANAGGVIRGVEWYLLRIADSVPSLRNIHPRMLHILGTAEREQRTTVAVADEMAETFLSGSNDRPR